MANNTNLSYPSAFCQQFLDRNGNPLSGGKLYTYKAGTSNERIATYKTIGGTIAENTNTNPIILDSAGVARLVIEKGKAYKFVLYDRNNNFLYEWDNVDSGGGQSVYNIEGTDGEITATPSTDLQGNLVFKIGIAEPFKQTINGLRDDVDELENRVDDISEGLEEAQNDIEGLENSVESLEETLSEKKDKQEPYSLDVPSNKIVKRISQDANGNVDVELQDIPEQAGDDVEIESSEGNISVEKSTPAGKQKFNVNVKDYSLDPSKFKVGDFKFFNVDDVTLQAIVQGSIVTLAMKSKYVQVVEDDWSFNEVNDLVNNGILPLLNYLGNLYYFSGSGIENSVNVLYFHNSQNDSFAKFVENDGLYVGGFETEPLKLIGRKTKVVNGAKDDFIRLETMNNSTSANFIYLNTLTSEDQDSVIDHLENDDYDYAVVEITFLCRWADGTNIAADDTSAQGYTLTPYTADIPFLLLLTDYNGYVKGQMQPMFTMKGNSTEYSSVVNATIKFLKSDNVNQIMFFPNASFNVANSTYGIVPLITRIAVSEVNHRKKSFVKVSS
jgi:hypothetical protein